MNVRITEVLDERDVFELVAAGDEFCLLQDYRGWLDQLDQEDTQQNFYEFCRQVVVEFINENPWYNAGDNHGNMTASVFNVIQDYREQEAERDSSRAASQGTG